MHLVTDVVYNRRKLGKRNRNSSREACLGNGSYWRIELSEHDRRLPAKLRFNYMIRGIHCYELTEWWSDVLVTGCFVYRLRYPSSIHDTHAPPTLVTTLHQHQIKKKKKKEQPFELSEHESRPAVTVSLHALDDRCGLQSKKVRGKAEREFIARSMSR